MVNKKANNKFFYDEEEDKESYEYDFLQIPEDSIYIENGEDLNSLDLIFEALQISILERGLENSFKVKKFNNIYRNLFNINKFYTQIVYTDPFNKEVLIPINPWLIKGRAPQLILAAQVDKENSMVNFIGIMTSKEFEYLLSKKRKKPESISLPFTNFNGDIDLLFSYTKSFNQRIISRDGLSIKLNSKKNNEFYKKEPILLLGLSFTLIASFILGPKLFNPKFASNFKCGNYQFKDFTVSFLNEIKESEFININNLGCSKIKRIDNMDSQKVLITTGRKNKKSISCLTDDKSEPCKFVLGEFYKDNVSPRIALKTIFDYEENQEKFLNETNSRLFINIYDALNKKYKNIK
tara:strand:- start:3377 stop:4429 length:1053 start_codon:yes stop_codon:yes gene_type:complete